MKLFKNFIAYRVPESARAWVRKHVGEREGDDDGPLARHQHRDPEGGSWREAGLANAGDAQLVADVNGAALLMCVQFNERILPAKVRDEHVKNRVAKLEDQTGRKVGKKEYAQLRSEVELELLPKSHIKRTPVPVMFIKPDLMLVFTSSAKRGDDVISVLLAVIPDLSVGLVQVQKSIPDVLTAMARDGTTYVPNDDGDDRSFDTLSAAVLKGPEKRVIRIKDHEIQSSDVQALLGEGFDVHELALEFRTDADGEPDANFTLNDKLVFRGFIVPDVKRTEAAGEQGAVDHITDAWLIARTAGDTLAAVIDLMGGEAEGLAAGDDDEL